MVVVFDKEDLDALSNDEIGKIELRGEEFVLGKEDLAALSNGEMVKVKLKDGEVIGLVTEKWVEEEID